MYKLSKRNYEISPENFLLKVQEKLSQFPYGVSSIQDIIFKEEHKYGRNILKVKPFCKLHKGEKSDRYIRLDNLVNNSDKKPNFCPKCFSKKQKNTGCIDPSMIQLQLEKSEDAFIRKHYSLCNVTKKVDRSGNAICILRCSQHELNFTQAIHLIGKCRGCDECNAEYRKTTIKKDPGSLQSIINKLGESSDHILINSFQKRSYKKDRSKYSKIWVNLTCTSENHIGNHNFWCYEEMITPKSCPLCNKNPDATGESVIFDLLFHQNELPEQKKILNDCMSVEPIIADFYLTINNQNLIIEFDGKQHFSESQNGGSQADLLERIKRDICKNDYAHEKGIHILRIYYKQLKDIDKLTTLIKGALDYLKSGNNELIEINPEPEDKAIYDKTYSLVSAQ